MMLVSDPDNSLWTQLQTVDELPETEFPFRSRSIANTFANRVFRRRERSDGGIVDECCIYKGCTV